jgi:hypothetical protein
MVAFEVETRAKERGAAEELSEVFLRATGNGRGVPAELIQCTRKELVNGAKFSITESFLNELFVFGSEMNRHTPKLMKAQPGVKFPLVDRSVIMSVANALRLRPSVGHEERGRRPKQVHQLINPCFHNANSTTGSGKLPDPYAPGARTGSHFNKDGGLSIRRFNADFVA